MGSVEIGIVIVIIGGVAAATYLAGRRGAGGAAAEPSLRPAAKTERDVAPPEVGASEAATAVGAADAPEGSESPDRPDSPEGAESPDVAEELAVTRVGAKFDLHAALMKNGAGAAPKDE